MPARKKPEKPGVTAAEGPAESWLAELATSKAVGGVPGPGRWLVAQYSPTALFSLKASTATSSVGKTLVVPTPYAIKMALVDAAFRSGVPEEVCATLVQSLAGVELRIAPPEGAVVTHTFVKIRQEPKAPDPLRPYVASIAYREFVHHQGTWRWAFDLAGAGPEIAGLIAFLAPRVSYVGKRGSFVQFGGLERISELSGEYSVAMPPPGDWQVPSRYHVALLDDFGPEASLEVLSSYTEAKPRAGKHRRYTQTLVSLGVVSTGPGFTEYRAR